VIKIFKLIAAAILVVVGTFAIWMLNISLSPADKYARIQSRILPDYGQLETYREADKLNTPGGIVFIGDSITEGWNLASAFPSEHVLNRGIGGQTTRQMLLRFQQDVVSLKPQIVVILGGTNDLAYGGDLEHIQAIEMNIESMVDIAEAHHIRPVLGTILPVDESHEPKLPIIKLRPNIAIAQLNLWLRRFSASKNLPLVDFASAVSSQNEGMRSDFTDDGLHPNAAGYRAMTVAFVAQQNLEAHE
jgi:lysophospholipase L1-like esterase